MSQIALLMMGEGHAYYKGELLDGKIALNAPEYLFPACLPATALLP
jgi:histidine ammonia-lyase